MTIKDLARASGFSVCTINKALNGKPWVSEATRRRVLELAAEMGYHPNRLAQALARRTLTLAVVYPAFWEHWFSPLVDGVRQGVTALQDHNIAVRFCAVSTTPAHADLLPQLEDLAGEGIDGCIICAGGYALQRLEETVRLLESFHLPVIQLGGEISRLPSLASVRVDTRRSGQMAAELLAMMTGGAPAAVFIGMRSDVDHLAKVEGFRAFTDPHACPLVDVYETREEPDRAYALAQRMCEEHPEVRSVYVAIDNSSPEICRCLLDRGMAGAIKVVATGVFPEIAALMQRGAIQCSLFQNTAEQGRLAVRILFDYLTEGKRPEREVLVPPFIALRSNLDLWK